MEVSGVVFRQVSCFSSSSTAADQLQYSFSTVKKSSGFRPNRKPLAVGLALSYEFSDKGHLQYYNDVPRMTAIMEKEKEIGSHKKEMKKKLKLLKNLSKNLSSFSEMRFGLNPADNGGLDQQLKGQTISDATEVLIGQLQKLKAEKMESKRMKKEEKAKKKAAAAQVKMMMDCCKESSESSSSSESECEEKSVVNTRSQLKTLETSSSNSLGQQQQEEEAALPMSLPVQIINLENRGGVSCDNNNNNSKSKKIEVCMGGKCKKSGAAMLLENFQKAVGAFEHEADDAVAVVGCKCMGKCRDGPNVRMLNNNQEDANADAVSVIGWVGLEDVDSIVTNFFFAGSGCSDVRVPPPPPAAAAAPALSSV